MNCKERSAHNQLLMHSKPYDFDVDEDTVHIWRLDLSVPEPVLKQYSSILSDDENERHARFICRLAGKNYLAAREHLRSVLGSYLNQEASTIRFNYGHFGKPELRCKELQFNLSHSGGLLVLAIGKRAVGIDIEQKRDMNDLASLGRSYMTAREFQVFGELDKARQLDLFFTLWSRKEALVKGTGSGFSRELRTIDLMTSSSAVLCNVEHEDWTVRDILALEGYSAAVAFRGHENCQLIFRGEFFTN